MSAPVPSPSALAGRSVLVVDDQPEVCEMLEDYLAHLGARVAAVTDGNVALEHLRRSSFDAIVTDLRMPGFDGGALVSAARQIDPGLVVIVMTGYPSFESALTVVRMGAHEYLRKPFDLAEVQRALSSGLASRENRPLAPELAQSLTLTYEPAANGPESATASDAALVSRLTALAWDAPVRALDDAGLMLGIEHALAANARVCEVRIDTSAVRVRGPNGSAAETFVFERPASPPASGA
jgi:CheY-like chemotaxis protein